MAGRNSHATARAAHSNIDVSRIGRSNRPREKDRERGPLRPGPARLTGTGGWFTHHPCSGAIGGTSSSSPCQCFTGSARSEASRAAARGGVRLRQWSLCEGAALWSASRPSKRGRVGEDNSSARPTGAGRGVLIPSCRCESWKQRQRQRPQGLHAAVQSRVGQTQRGPGSTGRICRNEANAKRLRSIAGSL